MRACRAPPDRRSHAGPECRVRAACSCRWWLRSEARPCAPWARAATSCRAGARCSRPRDRSCGRNRRTGRPRPAWTKRSSSPSALRARCCIGRCAAQMRSFMLVFESNGAALNGSALSSAAASASKARGRIGPSKCDPARGRMRVIEMRRPGRRSRRGPSRAHRCRPADRNGPDARFRLRRAAARSRSSRS